MWEESNRQQTTTEMKKTVAAVVAICVATGISAQTRDGQYAVPLKCAYRISGTYGELRGGHYHAGLDMSTFGEENVEVHAAEDGWVSRVKVGAYGYGRALYIDHADGHTTVYGHLNGFAAKIDSVIRREQYEKESFEAQIFLERGRIKVNRDEVVAYSGNTGGSGGPHLHFEVRDTGTEEPLNPMRFIATQKDDVPPTVYGVKIYALGDDAQVAGGQKDKYMKLAQISGKTVDVYGEIGVGVHCTDYVEKGGRPCGIVEMRLYDGERLVYRSRVDHFPFDLNKHVNSHIDYGESVVNKRYVQKAWVEPGNKLPIYVTRETPMVVGEGETHKMRYEVVDFAGNKSTVAFTLRGRRNAALGKKSDGKGDLVRWERTWAKDTLGVDVVIPHHSLYRDAWVSVEKVDRGVSLPAGYSIGDVRKPMEKKMVVTMSVPEKWKALGKKVFVGRVVGKGVVYAGGEMREDVGMGNVALICARVGQFGTYTVDVDTVAPSVGVRNKGTVVGRKGWIYIGVGDDKSGVARYEVRIDGRWEVFEYDYKKTRLKAQMSYLGIGKGSHTLEAVVEDGCGNRREISWKFRVE